VLSTLLAAAVARAEDIRTARAVATVGRIVVDGTLDEASWEAAPAHAAFVERRPSLRGRPAERTTFRVLFDADAVYVGVACFDRRPQRLVARTLTRDATTVLNDDAVVVSVDPSHDHRTAVGFALNAAGTPLDWQGVEERTRLWEYDPGWTGEARRTEDGWTAVLLRAEAATFVIVAEAPAAAAGHAGRAVAKSVSGWPRLQAAGCRLQGKSTAGLREGTAGCRSPEPVGRRVRGPTELGASPGVAGEARRKCLYLLVLASRRNEVQRRQEACPATRCDF